ncbi:MAG: tetratricopeptide repeat protein [Acidobacteriia bacterium]|nr:tetratricopeptide repeat protein [Terriglobia bacterium]
MGTHPQPGPIPAEHRRPARLESWKEIAAYLNRTVRTVQRWEQDEGLPIRRHSHEQRDSVHAATAEIDTWLSRRTPESKVRARPAIGPAPHGTRRWVLAFSLTAAVLGLGGAGWRQWAGSHPALTFAARDWIVLADFENQTSEAIFDRGLGVAFAVSLEQSRHANLMSKSRVAEVLRRMGKPADTRIDEGVGREICAREGAKGLIVPGISRVGRLYAISARLIDVRTGEAVAGYLERARNQDEILDAIGGLAAKVRRGLGEPLLSVRRNDRPLPRVTTRSLEALRAYAEGAAVWDHGDYGRGLELYRSAVQQDPNFAMAHAALGTALLSHVYYLTAEGKMHFERARQLSERVTERERLAIEARYQAALLHVGAACEAYQAYLASYPDDWEARSGYGAFLMRNGRAGEAVGQYLEVIRVVPGNSAALINLATAYKNVSRSADAIPYYQKAFALERKWLTIGNINHEYGFALAMTGNPPGAREVFAQAVAATATKPGGLRSLGLLAMLEGKYRDAAKFLKSAIAESSVAGDSVVVARNRLFLSILLAGKGDRAAAIAELDRAAADLGRKPQMAVWLQTRTAAMYARLGEVDKAQRLLARVADRTDRQAAAEAAELHLLEGEIALAQGEYSRAIPVLETAYREIQWTLMLAALCRAYDRAGKIDQAISSYQELIAKREVAAGWEPQQDALEACARLAEIYLDRGDKSKAAQAMEPLAKLWTGADADLPLVSRVARLRATPH